MPSCIYSTVFVDLDGTLLDSIGYYRTCYTRFLSSFSVKPSEEEFERLNGPSLDEIIVYLKDEHDLQPSCGELKRWYEQILLGGISDIKVYPDSLEFLEEVKKRRMLLALVSSTIEKYGLQVLECCGLYDKFDYFVWGDHVEKSKPDPSIYRLALERSGRAKDFTIAVEDSVNGFLSANAAGIDCKLVARDSKELEHIQPEHVVRSLLDISEILN